MKIRKYNEVCNEIKRLWASGHSITSGDDGFSKKVSNAMHCVGADFPGIERNKFYGKVYQTIQKGDTKNEN